MDENKKADEQIEAQGEEQPVESPTIQEPTEEVPQVEEQEASDTQPADTETEESPKKGFQSRVKELVKERDDAKEEANSLAQRLEELTGGVSPEGQIPQYQPQYEPGSEVTPEQYQQDVARTAGSIVELRLKQSEAINRHKSEGIDAVRKYTELDPGTKEDPNPNFNKELSDSITESVEAQVKLNPYSASVTKIVDGLMKPYRWAVSKEVGKATENIAKQVSETALRPTSIRKGEKTASEKSVEELEQELGIVQA